MFTHKDIQYRAIFIINCLEEKGLRVSNGELLLEQGGKTLTKIPFQKVLFLFIIGHATITTPLIDNCKKFNVALVVVKPTLRPVFYWANSADGNFLLRQKQYEYPKGDICVAKSLVKNKITNQKILLQKTRKTDIRTRGAILLCDSILDRIDKIKEYDELLSSEGIVAKSYFSAYFFDFDWHGRKPRVKCDYINVTLDIGYTMLFNFVECFTRMFGFDIYVGVYHRLWFKRKSLICDLMEPFRCIVDHTVRNALSKKQCKKSDFEIYKGIYYLKHDKSQFYHKMFCDAIISYKSEIYIYIQAYYRSFMRNLQSVKYPQFLYK